jgi:hypothetical protein
LACTRQIVENETAADIAGSTGSHGFTDSTTSSSTSSMPVDDTSGSTSTVADDDGSLFLIDPDNGASALQCDPWANDCPRGQKCMPWANDGGSAWNATNCVPIAPDPNQPGEPCTVEGSGVSGVDDCDVASMCWDVDPETNIGTCVAFCVGSAENPTCAAPCEHCVIANQGVLTICLAVCDPLVQDCDEGLACHVYYDAFVCMPDRRGADLGGAGDPCEYVNVCDPGLYCAPAELVPGCLGSVGCCTEFCDPALPAADQCTFAAEGVECVPWFEGPSAIAGCIASMVGACVLP